MAGLRLLDLVKPFVSFIPEVELPSEKLIFDEKVVYTIGVGAIYLLSGLPLNGVNPDKLSDPFYWLRSTFGSSSGTLLEFGLLPVITSAFFWQLLAGFKFIKVNFESRSDRESFQTLQKITSVVLTLVYSVLLVSAGYFNSIDDFNSSSKSIWSGILIVLQLTVMSGVVSLLVEILDKNYGFGPGVLALITISASSQLTTSIIGITAIKPNTSTFSTGYFQSTGALVQTIRNFTSKSIKKAVIDSFTRVTSTNLIQIYLALFSLAIIIYLTNFRTEVAIKSAKVRSMSSVYPIKLLYCGCLPLLFTFTVLYNLNIIVYSLTKIFELESLSHYLGSWKVNDFNLRVEDLTHGVLFFISPSLATSPCVVGFLVRPVLYSLFILVTSVAFAAAWVKCSGSASKDIAKQFKEQDITLVTSRDTAKELNKIIPTAAVIGAAIVASVACVFENLGAYGLSASSIIGVLSGLTILEIVVSEMQQMGGASSQIVQALAGQQ